MDKRHSWVHSQIVESTDQQFLVAEEAGHKLGNVNALSAQVSSDMEQAIDLT